MTALRATVMSVVLLAAATPLVVVAAPAGPVDAVAAEVPRAVCGPDDRAEPEDQLQGQVPPAERAAGFAGYSCNLRRVGGHPGPGGTYVGAAFDDCAYYATSGGGVLVVDLREPARPEVTATLTSPAMRNTWESLKVNPARALLAATSYGEDAFDVYSIADCRRPVLLSSTRIPGTVGHEGEWAPDGRTYYITNRQNYAVEDFGFLPVDLADPKAPKVLPRWDTPGMGRAHGLSLDETGTRMYLAVPNGPSDPGRQTGSGFLTLDVSAVQQRLSGGAVRVLSSPRWTDGGEAQASIPITVRGQRRLVAFDEWGSYLIDFGRLGCAAAANGSSAYGYPRLFDMTDERAPRQLRTYRLQVQDPANCSLVVNDTAHLFSYSTHYCSVDRRVDPRLLGCANFESGLRVFDIRDPLRPREVAYYNPPARPGTASEKGGLGYTDVDWANSPPVFRLDRGEIWVQFQDNGVQVLKLAGGALRPPAAAPPGAPAPIPGGAAVPAPPRADGSTLPATGVTPAAAAVGLLAFAATARLARRRPARG